jgi:hypothetical protein
MLLHRKLHITQKTAWFILHKIRLCSGCKNQSILNDEIEMDETYVGGKNRNCHANKKIKHSQGRSGKGKYLYFE